VQDYEKGVTVPKRAQGRALIAVAVLDALTAISSIFLLNDVGAISAGAQFVLFGALSIGIWRLKKWAWVTELALSAIQVALIVAGAFVLIILYADSVLSSDLQLELVGYAVGLLLLNGFVLWTLLRPGVRAQFNQLAS
jgi:hypothetical protein